MAIPVEVMSEKSFIISLAASLSKLLVGSSAITMLGEFINALAMETRRDSPPESCAGYISARSAIPTFFSRDIVFS